MKTYYVYILASKKRGTLYIGMTNDLARRIHEHKLKENSGFSKMYNTNNLVYYESTNSVESAINREKILKHWKREWKINLIEENNPEWKDLSEEF